MAKTRKFERFTRLETPKLSDFVYNDKLDNPALYCPSSGLLDAVDVALNLGLPLLLTGEPGTGKTQLASHINTLFKLADEPLVYTVQTTSTATDLFYRYDALGHLQYYQHNPEPLSLVDLEKRFIHYNALGQAIRDKKRVVVLIDEIDKAPRDLPNDILYAIDKLRFEVPELYDQETKKPVVYTSEQAKRPIIILTSNSEKSLPDAFLRRVVFYHIDFNEIDLDLILEKKTNLNKTQRAALTRFFNEKIRSLGQRMKKLPATAELLLWATVLSDLNFPIEKLGQPLSETEKTSLKQSLSTLAKNSDDLTLLSELF